MALQMSFSDNAGNNYDASYWRVVQVNISVPDKSALVVFYGYKDKDARDASKMPIGAKQYSIMGETFDTNYKQHLESGGPNIATMCYAFAKATLDTSSDNKTFVSFFKDAKDV